MASGQTLLTFEATDVVPTRIMPPATPDVRNGHPVLDFDGTMNQGAEFEGRLPRHYLGGGITLSIMWTAELAAGDGFAYFAVAFERHDPATDLDGDSFGPSVQPAGFTPNPVVGAPTYSEIVIAPAQLDGILPGEHFRLRVARVVPAGSFVGDLELWSIELRET